METRLSTIRFLARRLGAYLAAVAVAYLLASVSATQSVVASLGAMGVDVGLAERLAMTLQDIGGLAPMFLPLVAFALLIAFLCAALLSRWLPRWRLPLYLLAGATGLVCIHLALNQAFGITPVAIARSGAGLAVQSLAGAGGGLVYLALIGKAWRGRPLSGFAALVKGCAALAAITISTIAHTLVLYLLAIPKWLAPRESVRNRVRLLLARIAENWIAVNNRVLSLYRQPDWQTQIPAGLDRSGCYLVSCNHRSWVDILVLQRCFNRRLPLLRFFLKRELIRVPFLGLAWWALDFPFMRRASAATLERRPELKGRDLERARKACEKFRTLPVAMMNFPEGTRFSPGKRDRYGSAFRHLLTPRIGGMGQVLYALGDQLDALIDVTIVYPGAGPGTRPPTLWNLLTGRVPRVVLTAERRDIPADLRGRDFRADPEFRRRLEDWMTQLWTEKDALIAKLESPASAPPLPG